MGSLAQQMAAAGYKPNGGSLASQMAAAGHTPVFAQPDTPEPTDILSKAGNVANKFLGITGGQSVAANIGTLGGYLYTKAKDAIQGTHVADDYNLKAPSPLKTAGDAAQLALTALPVGKVAKGVQGAAEAVGVASKFAKPAAEVATSLGTGYGYDVASNVADGKTGAEAVKPGIGTAAGAVLPAAGAVSKVLRKGAAATAPTFINSLIKPLGKDFTYGKDPGRTVAQLGITGNSFEDLAKNVTAARQGIGAQMQDAAKSIPSSKTVSLAPALQPFDEAMEKAIANNDQPLLTRLKATKDALTSVFAAQDGKIVPVGSRITDDLTYGQGVDFKRRIGDLTKWTGQHTEDTTVNGALTRSYGAVKDELDKLAESADPETAKKLRLLNQQYADLTSAEVATKYRDILEKRHNMINLPGKIGLIGAAAAAPFTGGLTALGAAGASVVADKVLSSPAFKTRAAKVLAKAAPDAEAGLIKSIPGLRNAVAPGDAALTKRGTSNGLKVVSGLPASAIFLKPSDPELSYYRPTGGATTPKTRGAQLADAISFVETGGKQVKGGSGEFGSFQFMPETWKIVSKEVAGKVLAQTPDNERRIAEQKITKLYNGFRAKGQSDATAARNVALVWNSSLGGSEKPIVRKGINKKGVPYDSGAYAKRVLAQLGA